uniref:Ig-like domain-containing protein n=1 Tax=Neogobius melanostomus TaxID=47308 RepID=A0A8C6SXX0_9GOBI
MYLLIFLHFDAVHASRPPRRKAVSVTVEIGDALTLQCPHEFQIYKYYWYKQSLGALPRLVSNIYLGADSQGLENEFRADARFKLGVEKDRNHLNISDIRPSDSATYFCTTSSSMNFEFVQSVTVFVKGAAMVVRQAPLEDVQPGRPAVLKCSVHTGSCEELPRVHWFRESEESAAGVLYSHGGDDRCEETTDRPTNSCVYSLPIHNVSSEQTGTYYCAVAACGQVLFGNGTKLSVEAWKASSEILYILTGALMLTTSLLFSVTFCLCCKNSAESHERGSASSTKAKGSPKVVRYAAIEQVTENGRRPMDETWSECTYFSVDQ